ncbi:unnamed protein product, partial [Ilex paraguariensis]
VDISTTSRGTKPLAIGRALEASSRAPCKGIGEKSVEVFGEQGTKVEVYGEEGAKAREAEK